jgi:class 3 adenylate cyclase
MVFAHTVVAMSDRTGSAKLGRKSTGSSQFTHRFDKQGLVEELAALGDVTEDEEIFHLFQLLAVPPSSTVVDVENGKLILEVVGAIIDDTAFFELVGDQVELTYDQLRDLCQQLRTLATNLKDEFVGEREREVEIISLSVFAYVVKRITCRPAAPGTEYKVVGPSIEFKPRHVLIGSMGFVTLLCCGLMVMTVALLWLDHADSKELRTLSSYGGTTTRFLQEFERSMVSVNGEELRRTAAVVTTFADSEVFHTYNSALAALERRNRCISRSAVVNAMLITQRHVRDLVRLQTTLGALPTRLTEAAINASQRSTMTPLHIGMWNRTSAASNLNCSENCESFYPCLRRRSSTGVSVDPVSGLPANVATVTVDNVSICVSLGLAESSFGAETNALLEVRRAFVARFPDLDIISNNDSGVAELPSRQSCIFNQSCSTLRSLTVLAVGSQSSASGVVPQSSGQNVVVVTPMANGHSVVGSFAVAPLLSTFANEVLKPNIEHLNYVRAVVLGSTIEIVYFIHNFTTGIVSQASTPALPGCYAACSRPPPGFANANAGFEKHDTGWSITPDYRPEPVIGGYAYDPEATLDCTVAVERDVIEVRRIAMIHLTQVLDQVNLRSRESLEAYLVHVAGSQLTETYDPYETCPLEVSCITLDGFGIVYRSDCRHCTRRKPTNSTDIEYLVAPKMISECVKRGLNCSAAALAGDRTSVTWQALTRSSTHVDLNSKDYRNADVIAFTAPITNFSASLVITQDRNDIFAAIVRSIAISTGCCAAIIIVITLLFVLLARSLLQHIEQEWMQFKQLIHRERQAFSESVKEMMPAYIAERITKNLIVCGEHANVSISFVDLKGSSKRNESYDPPTLARFLTYTLHMMDAFATHYGIHRVRFVGDTSIFVAGLNETTGETSTTGHFTVRMIQFLSNIVQVMGPRYAHYPHRCVLMADTFGTDPFTMPDVLGEPQHVGCLHTHQCAVGVHQGGVTVSLVFFSNGAPHFDVLGPPVALAHRLCQTAKEGTILVSDVVKETLERYAPPGAISFGKMRKIVLRGRGTSNTCNVKATSIPLPSALFASLGIRYSRLRKYFDESDERAALRNDSRSSESASSRSELESNRGSNN